MFIEISDSKYHQDVKRKIEILKFEVFEFSDQFKIEVRIRNYNKLEGDLYGSEIQNSNSLTTKTFKIVANSEMLVDSTSKLMIAEYNEDTEQYFDILGNEVDSENVIPEFERLDNMELGEMKTDYELTDSSTFSQMRKAIFKSYIDILDTIGRFD